MPVRVGGARPQVAFDITPLQNAHRVRGIGRYVGGLARALMEQQEIPVEFWAWHDDRPFDVPPPHRALWMRRFGLPRTRWSWLLGPLGMRLRRRLSRVTLVHITDPRAFTPLVGRTVTTVYDLIPLVDTETDGKSSGRRAYRRYLRRLRAADGIFAISNQTAADLRTHLGIPPPLVWIAPPGVEIPSATEPMSRDTTPYFLYVGSPDPHKNLGVLIEGFARAAGLPEHLVLVGPWFGPNLEMLRQLVAPYAGLAERVRHRGFVPDPELNRLIRGATAVVVPSRREGFGLPVAETLAAGGVSLHSRIPVLMEVSQSAALSFDPASPAELADRLTQLSQQPGLRRQLQEKGMARARSLTWQPALDITVGAYRTLLGR